MSSYSVTLTSQQDAALSYGITAQNLILASQKQPTISNQDYIQNLVTTAIAAFGKAQYNSDVGSVIAALATANPTTKSQVYTLLNVSPTTL